MHVLPVCCLVFVAALTASCDAFAVKQTRGSASAGLQSSSLKVTPVGLQSLQMKTTHGGAIAWSPSAMVRSSGSTTALAAAASGTAPEAGKGDLQKTVKVLGMFGLWYALNIAYNIYNKKVLTMAPALTYTTGFLQLLIGLVYVLPLWGFGLRKKPEVSTEELKALLPLALCHLGTHLGAIVSLGAGAVSFTHIVKAAEPAVSAALSAVVLKSFLPIPVYLSLVPVMGGVALASLGELSFTWLAFLSAMVSNVSSAARGIVGKLQMGKSLGKNMDAMNLYAVMTILSAIMCLPVTLAVEGRNIIPTLQAMSAAGTLNKFCLQSFITAMFYYSYNEVAFLTLDNVSPVTHALGNTIKRVAIIITSVLVFGTKLTSRGVLGSSIAIAGVLLYSLLPKGKAKAN